MDNNLINEMVGIVGKDGVLTTPEDLAVYSYDGAFDQGCPEVVVLPTSTEQVSAIVKLAARERIPVVTRGMGSGLSAASVPFQGGIALAMTRMNRILEIDRENATIRVEAGIITAEMQAEVEKVGLFYPPDPSSNRHSTIGGNIACNAGGPRCLKYGVTADYVVRAKAPDQHVEEEVWTAAGREIGRLRVYFDGRRGGQETTFGQDATNDGAADDRVGACLGRVTQSKAGLHRLSQRVG